MGEVHISFVRERVKEIRSALFFNEAPGHTIVRTAIVSALDVDDEGHVCFFIAKPEQLIQDQDKHFPAKLDFYKKGKPFFLKVTGTAHLLTHGSELSKYLSVYGSDRPWNVDQIMLVKVKVNCVEYFENKLSSTGSGFYSIKRKVTSWLFTDDGDEGIQGTLAI